jgi:hypothetical protein
MAVLWLTYAWKDNVDQDVDFVAQQLTAEGLDVRFDRNQLLAGKRLWDQISAGISDPSVNAWAMLVTENSLASEPCQEEIAYALDRTLRQRGSDFPLIGIFPRPVSREHIPSALATRLYVDLRSSDWKQRIAGAVRGEKPKADVGQIDPVVVKEHGEREGGRLIEIYPRTGRWYPPVAWVPLTEKASLRYAVVGARGMGMLPVARVSHCHENSEHQMYGVATDGVVEDGSSLYVLLNSTPSQLLVGQFNGNVFQILPPPKS